MSLESYEVEGAGLASIPRSKTEEEQWGEFYNLVKDNISIANMG